MSKKILVLLYFLSINEFSTIKSLDKNDPESMALYCDEDFDFGEFEDDENDFNIDTNELDKEILFCDEKYDESFLQSVDNMEAMMNYVRKFDKFNVVRNQFECQDCKIDCNSKIALDGHYIVNHTDKLICPVCSVEFKNKDMRKNHLFEEHCICTICFNVYTKKELAKICNWFHLKEID